VGPYTGVSLNPTGRRGGRTKSRRSTCIIIFYFPPGACCASAELSVANAEPAEATRISSSRTWRAEREAEEEEEGREEAGEGCDQGGENDRPFAPLPHGMPCHVARS